MSQLTHFTPVLYGSCTGCRKHGDEKLLSADTRNHHGDKMVTSQHHTVIRRNTTHAHGTAIRPHLSYRNTPAKPEAPVAHQYKPTPKDTTSEKFPIFKTDLKVFPIKDLGRI